jgi:hypothetical protein
MIGFIEKAARVLGGKPGNERLSKVTAALQIMDPTLTVRQATAIVLFPGVPGNRARVNKILNGSYRPYSEEGWAIDVIRRWADRL